MGKRKHKRAAGAKGSNGLGNMHPIMKQAISSGARLDRGTFEVVGVANPYGEVIIRGEVRRHKAVRRVPHFETLFRSKLIDQSSFDALAWYADRLSLSQSGLIKCGLDVSGSGGGSAFHHVPTTQAALEARSDVRWARGFLKGTDVIRVFDGVMDDGATFEVIGAEVFPNVCLDRAKRKASAAFKLGVQQLLSGIGPRVLNYAEAD